MNVKTVYLKFMECKDGDNNKTKDRWNAIGNIFNYNILFINLSIYIYKEVMANVSDSLIALSQIINCLSVVILGSLWNKKSDKLFKYYPVFCVGETVLSICSTIWAITTHNIMAYYMIDTLIFAIVTRNICCGGVKLRAIRYNSEIDREHFDNNNNSASAIATILGSVIAMMLDLDFSLMLWLATFGNAIDNIFYIFIYKSTQKGRN